MGGLDAIYKPLPIYVLDPLEITAMGLKVRKGRNGERRWEQALNAKWSHPDPQKTVCVHEGAIIYSALFPERTHKDHRPPADWLKEAGITEATLAEAKSLLELDDPNFQAKRDVRAAVNDAMDAAYGKEKK